MPGVVIHTTPETMVTRYHAAERAAVSTWLSFRGGRVQEAIRESVPAAAKAGARTLIVDISSGPGVMTSSDMEFTMTAGAKLVAEHRFAAFVNVVGDDALTRAGSRRWKQTADQNGVPSYECASVADALALARDVAAGRRPAAA